MRPLFLFCRASGASIKYLYDKTFEMNPFLPKIGTVVPKIQFSAA